MILKIMKKYLTLMVKGFTSPQRLTSIRRLKSCLQQKVTWFRKSYTKKGLASLIPHLQSGDSFSIKLDDLRASHHHHHHHHHHLHHHRNHYLGITITITATFTIIVIIIILIIMDAYIVGLLAEIAPCKSYQPELRVHYQSSYTIMMMMMMMIS